MNTETVCLDVCQPIEDVEEVLNWKKPVVCWASLVRKLERRTDFCCHTYPVCSVNNKPNFQKAETVPKTLVCHDMKGGYLADRWVNGTDNTEEYKFLLWSCIDIFVYFSHKLVTIPPLCWINAGHIHGVKVLGTIITEGPNGCSFWNDLATNEIKLYGFADQLAAICDHYGFDGYLINIENSMSYQVMESFVSFLEHLIKNLKTISPDKTIIWYDAVTFPFGKLLWQNKLNIFNKKFFDICDGIFLNYGWSEEDLIETVKECGSRKTDAYVGVDVFGRGVFGGGGFTTCQAMDVIRKHGLSAAIFAPGWVHENCEPDETADNRDFMFWELLTEYLYCYGPARIPFKTSFCRGFGHKKYKEGRVVMDQPWFNLSEMNHMPGLLSGIHQIEESSCFVYYQNDAYEGGGCLLVKPPERASVGKHCDRLFVCDFYVPYAEKIHIKVASKPLFTDSDPATLYDLILSMVDHEDCDNHSEKSLMRKVCLPVISNIRPEDSPNKWILSDFIFEVGCAHIVSIDCRLISDKTPVLIGYFSISTEDTEPSEIGDMPINGSHSPDGYCSTMKIANVLCDSKKNSA
ncbi:cytosolic endo-beta-N-acetylglucosaminidase [Halyomorpha halys]|uniref:cytosolic endo-beta-N-acetylglucosaminidase n=1 Tax=Halyomorpha halys TaxID=286706 RepID=UPI0006D4DF98|nr:cytosolic endo-beta-N-acetylglucosaminidase [Halyomorpha halys]